MYGCMCLKSSWITRNIRKQSKQTIKKSQLCSFAVLTQAGLNRCGTNLLAFVVTSDRSSLIPIPAGSP